MTVLRCMCKVSHRKIIKYIRHKSSRDCGGELARQILRNTEVSRNHMTPEIELYLITQNCPLWHGREEDSPFPDLPFWGFYWPGGQVLTRFILDNGNMFRNQSILDVGSGCGATSIACKLVGAAQVTANDIDSVAIDAIKLNSKLNGVTMETNSSNLIGSYCKNWSTVLLADMFYDVDFANQFSSWLPVLFHKYKVDIFIGDPGRLALMTHPMKNNLSKVAEYELPEQCRQENNGLSAGFVWQFTL